MNMRKTGILAAALLVLGLAACGSDDDAFQTGSGPAGAAKVASVTVITDTPTIPSSGLTPANISVLVRDTNNQFLKEVPVQKLLMSAAVDLLPRWARDMHGLGANLAAAPVRAATFGLASTLRWAFAQEAYRAAQSRGNR